MSGGRSTACARSSRRSRNCSSSGSGSVPMSGRPHRLPERCERAVEVHPHRCLRALQHRRDLRRRQLLLYLKDHGRALLRREPAHGLPEPLQRPLPSDRVHGVVGGCGLAVEEWLVRFGIALVTHPELPAPMLAPLIEAQVDDDAVEPGRELRAAVEAPRRLEDPDEGLLRQVARVLGVSHDGPREPVRAPLVARDEGVKRRLVALGRAPAQHLVRELHAAIVLSSPRSHSRLIHCKGGAPGASPASTPPALLPVRLARLVDVTPQVATIATEVAGILAAILLVRLEILALLFDVLEIRLYCVLVAGLAVLVELPPVLPEVAPVLADVPRVLSDVLAISTNVSPVLRHVPVRSELTAVLAEIAPVLLDIPHVLAQVPAVLTDVLEVLRDSVLVTRLAILVELPAILAQIAPVFPDVPGVLSNGLPVLADVLDVPLDLLGVPGPNVQRQHHPTGHHAGRHQRLQRAHLGSPPGRVFDRLADKTPGCIGSFTVRDQKRSSFRRPGRQSRTIIPRAERFRIRASFAVASTVSARLSPPQPCSKQAAPTLSTMPVSSSAGPPGTSHGGSAAARPIPWPT